MRTTCLLVKINILLFTEPIREGVRNKSHVQVCDAQMLKVYPNWLNKWTFHDTNQSEIMLEGSGVKRALALLASQTTPRIWFKLNLTGSTWKQSYDNMVNRKPPPTQSSPQWYHWHSSKRCYGNQFWLGLWFLLPLPLMLYLYVCQL